MDKSYAKGEFNECIVLSLLTMYGIDLGLDFSKIYPLSKYFREITGMKLRGNRGIFGDDIYDIESGIVAAWHENVADIKPLLLSPFLPSLVGHKDAKIAIGKHSGLPTVDHYLNKFNIDVSGELKAEILVLIKEKAYKKSGLLTTEEFMSIVDEVR